MVCRIKACSTYKIHWTASLACSSTPTNCRMTAQWPLTGLYFSHDGKYTAYTISRSGSDWSEIYVMDTESGKLLEDHIEWAKFTDAAWQGDGFYYSAYDAPTKGKEFSNVNENHKIYYHKIGEPQSKDKLIYQNPAYPKRFYTSGTSEDERILFLTESGAGRGNNLFIRV